MCGGGEVTRLVGHLMAIFYFYFEARSIYSVACWYYVVVHTINSVIRVSEGYGNHEDVFFQFLTRFVNYFEVIP